MLKLAAICCTYLRPETLGEVVASFLRQDYPAELRQLVILDDAGQYAPQSGPGWQLVSVRERFATMGEKRNAATQLADDDVQGYLVTDDDDIYLPHWFSSCDKALQRAEWSLPSQVYWDNPPLPIQLRGTRGKFHGGWGIRRETFWGVGGYQHISGCEDLRLARALHSVGTTTHDPSREDDPYYIYRVRTDQHWQISFMGQGAYERLAEKRHVGPPLEQLKTEWQVDYDHLARQTRTG